MPDPHRPAADAGRRHVDLAALARRARPALTGVFRTGDNPVVDIQFPASVTGASLWVMVVDNTGKVFHVLPNINQTDVLVDDLGQGR